MAISLDVWGKNLLHPRYYILQSKFFFMTRFCSNEIDHDELSGFD